MPVANLFQEDWWLETASAGRLERAEVAWDGKVVASLPFMMQNKFGMRRVIMPPYTRTLGVKFAIPPCKPFQRGHTMRRLAASLVKQLPAYDYFQTVLAPEDDSAFAFSLTGLLVNPEYTFRIPPNLSSQRVLQDCDQKTRNLIRSSGKRLAIEHHLTLSRFIHLSERSLSKQQNRHDYPLLESLFQRCIEHDATIMLSAVDEDGRDVASVVLIWDSAVLYHWLSARRRDLPTGGANALLIWHAIRLAEAKGLTFDFDGYNSPSNARFLASFGRPPVARLGIVGQSLRYRAANWLRHASRQTNGQPAAAD